MMKQLIYIFTLTLFIVSCGSEVEQDTPEANPTTEVVGSVTEVETLFDLSVSEFEDPLHYKLIKELDVCDDSVSVDCPRCATCTPRFFKIHKISKDQKEEDFFGLQIKALTILKGQEFSLPVRHLLIFEREEGSLVKVNGFRGDLVEKIVSSTGRDDLIVRFYMSEDDAFLNCLFQWEEGKYQFKTVEEIHGGGGNGRVKESMKADISKQVYAELMANQMIF